MSNELGPRQRKVLNFIRECVNTRGYPPSVREIADAVGLASPSTVHAHLSALQRKGYLRKDPSKPRAIEVHGARGVARSQVSQVPLVGRVAAGVPTLATEHVEDVMPLPAALLGDGDFFMLKVRGDSMIEAGINEGDLVVVRQQPDASNGDIVVALLDDEATVKTLVRDGSQTVLRPENKTMAPIPVVGDARIMGKVVALIRSYAKG